ncbi:MAG: mandelate racemase/muconate lactonizing enzyme family protein [Kineosporiaceae bacterium]
MSRGPTVAEVEFVGLRTPLAPPAAFSWGRAGERNVGLVRVRRSDGVTGWGETSVTFPLWSLEERAGTVGRGVAPSATGLPCGSPEEIAAVTARLDAALGRLRQLWSPVAISAAVGALEMALLDAWARAHGQPAWRLLGGSPDPVPLYAVGFPGPAEEIVAGAARAVADGYRAVKLRVGFSDEADLDLVRRAVAELGAERVLLDANMAWTRGRALEMADRLAGIGAGWLEEPVARDDVAGLAEVRSRSGLRVAAGENCYAPAELHGLLDAGAVDVLMPDLARCGGLLGGLAAAREALARGLAYSPHHYASDVGFAAALTVCAVAGPSAPLLRDVSPWPVRHELLGEPLDVRDGLAHLPTAPGLAPAPDPRVIERSRVL